MTGDEPVVADPCRRSKAGVGALECRQDVHDEFNRQVDVGTRPHVTDNPEEQPMPAPTRHPADGEVPR